MLTLNSLEKKKNKLDGQRPFPYESEKNLHAWDCVEFTYSSNAIEGNSLSRLETAQLIEKGITGASKPLRDYLEARNHAEAYIFLLEKIKENNASISEDLILKLNAMILKGTDDINGGRYRNVAVRIRGGSVVFPNPAKVPTLMQDYLSWLNHDTNMHPVEIAAQAHYRFVTIHPFVDGNGRCARLLMNYILGINGYPPAIIDIKKREIYLKSLEKAQNTGDMSVFLNLIYEAIDCSLDNYLMSIF